MELEEKLITEAREWLGTPWMHNQCVKGVGVDCVRFLAACADACDIERGDIPKHYDRLVQNNSIVEHLKTHFLECPLSEPITPGNILVFKFYGIPHHVAIATHIEATNQIGIIHASAIHEKVVQHALDEVWLRILLYQFKIHIVLDCPGQK